MLKHENITLPMGAGGVLTQNLLEEVFFPTYGNATLEQMDDAAEIPIGDKRIAFTTDSFTVKPIFFPGGDIGKLAVFGTVNDLAVKGARPLVISAGFIIEEGFPISDLHAIARSMNEAATQAGIQIVTGDTKVVGKGEADGIYINTSGIGLILDTMKISGRNALPGDRVIISGSIADHGIAIFNAREKLGFQPEVQSDVADVWPFVEVAAVFGNKIHAMRDPTRGGVATVLNEIATMSNVNITIFENELPIKAEVGACCDLLGLDPLYLANEGKVIIVADASVSDGILKLIRLLPLGKDARVIGEVETAQRTSGQPPVVMETTLGTRRFVPILDGDPLPRIC